MKHFPFSLFGLFVFLGFQGPAAALEGGEEAPLVYTVDLSDPSDDLFHVSVETGVLGPEDRYFDFVAFAPGVHSILNFGRFVQELRGFDDQGQELPTKAVGMNRWELAEPTRVRRIDYVLEDTLGSEVEGHPVTPYASTGIEEDYVILNPFGVCGYLENHLERPVQLRLEHDPSWVVGTALRKRSDGSYHAPSYRRLADSPFLLGELSQTGIFVGDIEIEIFVHAKSKELNAEEVMFVAGDMLEAAERFIGFAPVKRYALLIDFMDGAFMRRNRVRGAGALEHSYSSFYTMPSSGAALEGLAGIIAHEFMHILTPLHLRSTLIADFDYSIPTTDSQLWLYEGLTEWTADMLRLRGGLMDLETYLGRMAAKMRNAGRYREDYSLARLSLEWSTAEGLAQYGNIYQLGALTAMMLDLRILELSGGERGLREVFLDLIKLYGEARPFDDETFLEDFIAASYPEVAEFMEAHVTRQEPMPYAESFALLGIEFRPSSSGSGGLFRVLEDASPEQLAACLATVQKMGHAVMKAFGAEGVTVQQFNEAAGGQEVFHLHYHVLPRHDSVSLRPPGQMADFDVLKGLAEKIRAAL